MPSINLEIIAPTGVIFQGDCQMVIVPSTDGDIGIMHGHEVIAATLKTGQIVVSDDKDNVVETFDVTGGFVEVKDAGNILVLVD